MLCIHHYLYSNSASPFCDSYAKQTEEIGPSTSTPHGPSTSNAELLGMPHPPSSVTAGESERDDFQIAGVQPLAESEGLELLEER